MDIAGSVYGSVAIWSPDSEKQIRIFIGQKLKWRDSYTILQMKSCINFPGIKSKKKFTGKMMSKNYILHNYEPDEYYDKFENWFVQDNNESFVMRKKICY